MMKIEFIGIVSRQDLKFPKYNFLFSRLFFFGHIKRLCCVCYFKVYFFPVILNSGTNSFKYHFDMARNIDLMFSMKNERTMIKYCM